jgi:D-3-phosphoglycerate dehydrogenase
VRIVNAARGALIDEPALIAALESGKVAGAALDVLTEEPPDMSNPLLQMDNVVVTPHLAASTQEAQREVGLQVVQQVVDALHETDFRNAINMPIVDGRVIKEIRPYLGMAERLGSLQTQLAPDAITRVEVSIEGEMIDTHIKPITVAILKGLLEPVPHRIGQLRERSPRRNGAGHHRFPNDRPACGRLSEHHLLPGGMERWQTHHRGHIVQPR